MDKDLGDLAPSNDATAGIACLACVALQEYKLVLVRTVIVKPTGPHNGVWQSTGAS